MAAGFNLLPSSSPFKFRVAPRIRFRVTRRGLCHHVYTLLLHPADPCPGRALLRLQLPGPAGQATVTRTMTVPVTERPPVLLRSGCDSCCPGVHGSPCKAATE
jgi:hypothetical protein